MLDLEFAQLSDVGLVRQGNEDYAGCAAPATPERARHHGWLFVLADGVGGHEKGEVASRAAVESVLRGFESAPDGESLLFLLPRLVQDANHDVLSASPGKSPEGREMATTIVTCGLRYDRAVIAHVGDSRCYLVRQGQATLLTRDHTLANEQARLGMISAAEVADSPNRHILVRSLGADMFVNVDTKEHHVQPGDVLVLCSDGLHGAVSAADIARVVSGGADLDTAARGLVALANERDGGDNVTVQLIRIRSVERVGMYRGRPYSLR